MKYILSVLERSTGKPGRIEIVAETEQKALREAGSRGFLVEKITELPPAECQPPVDDFRSEISSLPAIEATGQFKVELFSLSLDAQRKDGRNPAEQLQRLINSQFSVGWKFVRLESVSCPVIAKPSMAYPDGVVSRASTYFLAVFEQIS